MLDLLNNIITSNLEAEQRIELVKKVRQFGDLNTDAILDPACKLFSISTIDGFIGFRLEGKFVVIFGDPLCPKKDRAKLIEAFKTYCRQNKLKIVSTIISDGLANDPSLKLGNVFVSVTHKLTLNPQDNSLNKTGSKAHLVRKKAKHALKDNVTIHEYKTKDPLIEKAIEEVGKEWLSLRKGPQIFIAHQNFFKDTFGKRWFYAKREDRIVGFLILNMIKAGDGWLLNNLIITPDAPSGTSELLITSTLEILKNENCQTVIVGPVVTKEIDTIKGAGLFSLYFLKLVFKIAKSLFRLDRQTTFWDKFQPKSEKSYLIFEKANIQSIKALFSSMNATI